MPEDDGIVPQRRTVMVGGQPREIRGPYDLTYNLQERLEPLVLEESLAQQAGDPRELRRVHRQMLDILLIDPLTDEEFGNLPVLEVPVWIATFLADVGKSSEEMAKKVMALIQDVATAAEANGSQPQSRSAPTSRRTTKQRTR